MMREACNVISLLLDARSPGAIAEDPVAAVLAETRSPAPLRQMLEKRSDTAFFGDLHKSLVDDGLTAVAATHALAAVTNWPVLSVLRSLTELRRTELLQAVIVEPTGEDPGQLVVVTATLEPSKPPKTEKAAATVLPVDLKDESDWVAVAVQVEEWWLSYGPKSVTIPPAGAPRTFGLLGDPATSGYRNVPGGWTSRITAMAAVLGMTTFVAPTPAHAKAQSLHQRLDVAFMVNGAVGWAEQCERLTAAGKKVLKGGQPGTSFNELLMAARDTLVPFAFAAARPIAHAPRELLPGQCVYHRKIANSGGAYDSFGEGSTSPCKHGAGAFVRFSGTDKALKGMQRIYTNFEGSMLYHCRKFPNCGMYCASRGAD